MKKRRENNAGYLKTTAKLAPVFAAKAAIADFPKGAIEATVENKLKGRAFNRASLVQALKGKAAGRAVGGVAGVLTAPLFLRGINLAGSKDKKDRAKGLGLLATATGLYGAQKGAFEGYAHARTKSAPRMKSLAQGARLGLARASHKIPASLLLGASLAAAHKGKDGEKPSIAKKYGLPALTGAAVGAGARGYESVASDMLGRGVGLNKASLAKALRRAIPKTGGGAASGLLGGLVLSGVVDIAKKAIERK